MRRCRAHSRARKAHTLHTITHTWRLHAGKFIRLLRALFFHENTGQVKILKMTAFFGFVIFFMVCWLRLLHRGRQRRSIICNLYLKNVNFHLTVFIFTIYVTDCVVMSENIFMH